MRKQRNQPSGTRVILRLWTYAEATKATPYLRCIVRSLRERGIELQQARLTLQRIDARQIRSDRQALIQREEARRDAELAEEQFGEEPRAK